jgi:DNA polymerase (family X)
VSAPGAMRTAMPDLDASAVAKLLGEFGQRSALRGGNPYRARAYRRAAENLLALTTPLSDMIAQDRLHDIPGVGTAIADIIRKLHATGSHPTLDAMRKEIPEGVLEMLTIPGLRPDKVAKIYKELGIASIEELEGAATEDRLKGIKGLGPALQRKILQGLELRRRGHGGRHLHRAAALLKAAEENLRASHLGLKRIAPAGSFRRGCELVDDLILVAEAPALEGPPQILQASTELSVHLADSRSYSITLLHATGSASHIEALQALAQTKGLSLDKDGLRRRAKVVASKTEADVYAALGLPFIEPELREGGDEIELALAGRLPRLVSDGDIRGILHAHTDLSDGVNTLAQMADAVRERGYGYFGVADHSQSARYAGGLSLEEIAEQHAEIDRLNARYDGMFRICKGIEADILADGSLDYADDVLDRFDFVIASVHSRFRLDREAQTARILRAVANPYTTILGHMTGRQLLRRPGYDVDIEKILAACAAHGVAVEINANPWRLDLDWRWHRRAVELGCWMSINPDAHSIAEIDLTHWGVEMARKGGLPKERVLNCLDLGCFMAHLEQRSPARGMTTAALSPWIDSARAESVLRRACRDDAAHKVRRRSKPAQAVEAPARGLRTRPSEKRKAPSP